MLSSLIFYTGWTILTLAMGITGLPCLISRKACFILADYWCDASLWLLKTCCNIQTYYPKITPYAGRVFAANHESTLDTLILWRALQHPAFILKRELLLIPVFGWYLWRVHPIAIARGNKGSIHPMIAQARARLAENRAIIIFPEGTRSAPERIIPYKRGVALLAEQLNSPVTCLMLATHHVWPKGQWKKRAGNARLQMLETIPPPHGKESKSWLVHMAGIIRQARAGFQGT